jgi:hypothetical protein
MKLDVALILFFLFFHSTYCISMKMLLTLKNKLNVDLIDSDVNMTIDQLITSKGYNLQIHFVRTSDGYILKLFRILPKAGDHSKKFLINF